MDMTQQIKEKNVQSMTSFLKSMLKKEKIDCSNLKFLYYHSYQNGDIEKFGWETIVSIYIFENDGILYLIDPEQVVSREGVQVSQLGYKSFKINE